MVHDAAITPVAAVTSPADDRPAARVVAAAHYADSFRIAHPQESFRVAAAFMSAPPPPAMVNAPGALRIPQMALSAYRKAEQVMAMAQPDCGVSWNLLAGIGRIESMHASGGATDARGTAVRPIYGPVLDGTLPGNEIIVQSSVGGRVSYARAIGPMQFLPGTWARYASDGDGDGTADPQNLYDSTLAAARYLCSGSLNLRDQSQVMAAILRYNNSRPYAQNVLGWAAAYATGVAPVNLPPIVGPPPPIGDIHLENPQGLGPSLPFNVHSLPSTDPLAAMPLIDLEQSGIGPQQPNVAPGQRRPGPGNAGCTLICIEAQEPAAVAGPPQAALLGDDPAGAPPGPPGGPPGNEPAGAPPGPPGNEPSGAGPRPGPAN
jgi:membrane-bound lytic murein transglycosylase B